MKYTPQIRTYEPQDFEEVKKLFRLNAPKYFAEIEESDLDFYLKNEIELYFVLTFKDQIIGCGGINYSNKITAKISWDFIHPAHHGKGWGKLLLQHRLNFLLSQENIRTIIVRTSQMAHKFYEKQGFLLKELVLNYWADGYDLYHMEYDFQKDI